MQVFTISDLIAAHWRDTIVLQGETPEAYAIRQQEARLAQACVRIGVGVEVRTGRRVWYVRSAGCRVEWLRGD